MNYATLQTDVASYLHRTDLTAFLPGFVERAEAFLFRELPIKDLTTKVAGTTTGEYFTLPSDLGSISKVTVTIGSSEVALDYMAQPVSYSTTYPEFYSFDNGQGRIWGASGQAYTLYYTPNIAALSGSNTSNWLLVNAQDLYFYAVALEAARFIRNQVEIAGISAMIPTLMESVKSYSNRKSLPATGSMQIRAR